VTPLPKTLYNFMTGFNNEQEREIEKQKKNKKNL
jgi:hypothetical protein